MTSAVKPADHTLAINGLRLHYTDYGAPRPGARRHALLHGLTSAWGVWRHIGAPDRTLQDMDLAIPPAQSVTLEQARHQTYLDMDLDMEPQWIAIAAAFFAARARE